MSNRSRFSYSSEQPKLGRFGVITVEAARDLAKVKVGQLAKGDDPAKKPDNRRKTTVAALCDCYLEEANTGRILGRRNRPIKASTLAMDKSRIETHIKPLLGKALVHTLKIADIERMQSDTVAGKNRQAARRRPRRCADGRPWRGGAHGVDVAEHPRAGNAPGPHRGASEQGFPKAGREEEDPASGCPRDREARSNDAPCRAQGDGEPERACDRAASASVWAPDF